MNVARRDRASFVSDQRGDRRLAIAEIASKACERMPQRVRCPARSQLAERRDARPKFRETAHAALGAGSGEHEIARWREAPQNLACSLRERAHASAGFRVAERRGAPRNVNLIRTQPQCLAGTPTCEGEEVGGRHSRRPNLLARTLF